MTARPAFATLLTNRPEWWLEQSVWGKEASPVRTTTLSLLALCAVSVGCSDSTPGSPRSTTSSTRPTQPALVEPAIGSTAEAFLRAILAGDSAKAAKLLTSKAATRYAADRSLLPDMGMTVERLTVGEIRLLNDAEAAVQCLVSESAADAVPQELCCLLKREPSGWRVAGIAADREGDETTVISFEGDPAPSRPSQLVDKAEPTTEAMPRTASGAPEGTLR